jgi:hypothetical protein
MMSPFNKVVELFGTILSIGIRAYVIATIIEVVLFLIAFTVGVIVWINKDFFAGLGTGMVVFIFGQILVMIILDLMFIAPEREADKTRLPSDDVVLQSLRAELTTGQNKAEMATPRKPSD